MSTAQPQDNRNCHLWVVANNHADALCLGAELGSVGLQNSVTSDLQEALECGAEVVVIDAAGWEDRCRYLLEALADDPVQPPPAILFYGPDEEVLQRAGPAYGHVHSGEHTRELAAAIAQARRAQQRFCSYWPAALAGLPAPERQRIQGLLVEGTGMEIRADRTAALVAAVRRRMLARLTPRVRDYMELLDRSRGRNGELVLLSQQLVIGETYFWRYSGQFQSLQKLLIPALVATPREGNRTLRLWSAGCSTGEEAYSLVIACLEAMPVSWGLEVWGSDIDRIALAQARRGVYGERSLRNLPAALREKYLERVPGGMAVRDSLRRRVHFEYLNLGSAQVDQWVAQSGPFDAVFCRNTLIYFARSEVERLVGVFAGSLVEGGGLFLGASETIHPQRRELEAVRAQGSFFFRKQQPGSAVSPAAVRDTAPQKAAELKIAELYGLGMSRVEAEDFPGAGEVFEEIIGLSPEDARGHTGMGLLLANQGCEVEAAQHLERAQSGEPPLAETSYLLGLVQERSGGDLQALHHYETALRRDPQFFMAHVNRAWILRRAGRSDRFREEMHAAFSILRQKPRVSRWVTGGLSWEALLELVGNALSCEAVEI